MESKNSKSVIKSLRITPKNDEKIDILGINLPFFVEKQLEKEYFLQFFGEVDKKILDYQNKIYELKKLKRKMNPIPKNKEEIEFLNETRDLLKNNPKYLEGRIKSYSNLFGKILFIGYENLFIDLVKNFDKPGWKLKYNSKIPKHL